MKVSPLFASVSVLAGFAAAANAKLNIVATTPDLGTVASAIGGDRINITTLARATEDPHFVDAKPSFIVKLNHADALIEGGADLEIGWLPPLVDGARNRKLEAGAPGRIACAQGVSLLEVPATLDRSKGDLHAAGNPHYTTDPLNAKVVAAHLCESFCQLDSKDCDAFRANLARFNTRLEAKMQEWEKLLGPFKGRRVVTYHNYWPYFAQRFGLRIDLFLEPKPGIPPTPSHLAEVIETMRIENIRVIMVSPYQNRKTAEAVASHTSGLVLDVSAYPGGTQDKDNDYIEWMDSLVHSLAKALAETGK